MILELGNNLTDLYVLGSFKLKSMDDLIQRIDFASSRLKIVMKQKIGSYEDNVLSYKIDNRDILLNLSYKFKAVSFADNNFDQSLN